MLNIISSHHKQQQHCRNSSSSRDSPAGKRAASSARCYGACGMMWDCRREVYVQARERTCTVYTAGGKGEGVEL